MNSRISLRREKNRRGRGGEFKNTVAKLKQEGEKQKERKKSKDKEKKQVKR